MMRNVVISLSLLLAAAPAHALPAMARAVLTQSPGAHVTPTPSAVCGDASCNGSETCVTCVGDCGACEPECGDAECNGDETCLTCEEDCGACGSQPYALYPSLDLAEIPWQLGSGNWGPQVEQGTPTLPATTSSASCSTASCVNTNAAVAGRKITITGTGWTAADTVGIHADDVEIVLPSGAAIGAVEMGGFGISAIHRFYLHATTPGDPSSGGTMGQLRNSGFTDTTDVVLDGVHLNGDSNYGGSETNQAFRLDGVTRLAVLHTDAIAAGYIWEGDAKHWVVADCNFYHGAATRAATGFNEGWGIRNQGGPGIIVDSRIQGTRYHALRVQSFDESEELVYVTRSMFVEASEGALFWLWNNVGTDPDFRGFGGILKDNDFYTYSTGDVDCASSIGSSILADHVGYSRATDNVFHGAGSSVFDQGNLDAVEAGGGDLPGTSTPGDHDWSDGNTFVALTGALPSWPSGRDPTAIALPSGFGAVITGEGDCPGYTP